MAGETALILPVPEAEHLVARWRGRYDKSAAAGVPAHVTILYPFLDPSGVAASDTAALRTFFSAQTALDVAFARSARFGDRILYLAPEPEEPLLALLRRVWDGWPHCVPYGGAVPRDAVRPHLTVADGAAPDELDRIEARLRDGLPVRARLAEARLIENRSGRWETRESFRIG